MDINKSDCYRIRHSMHYDFNLPWESFEGSIVDAEAYAVARHANVCEIAFMTGMVVSRMGKNIYKQRGGWRLVERVFRRVDGSEWAFETYRLEPR